MYKNLTPEGIEQEALMEGTNIAEFLDEDKLKEIAKEVIERFDEDFESASGWRENINRWKVLAVQKLEAKNEPWNKASNVKFPLLTIAAMQFHARAYAASVSGPQPVLCKVYQGRGQSDEETERVRSVGESISKYMSRQITSTIPGWMDGHDRLCLALAIDGVQFKKTYYDQTRKKIMSRLVDINNLAIDYYATDFDGARKTERIFMPKNELIERMRSKEYVEYDLDKLNFDEVNSINETDDDIQKRTPTESPMVEVYESHCTLDLDDDGYEEPYIVVVEMSSEIVLGIHARWDADESIFEEDEPVVLKPVEYYTSYTFIPDPGSNIYSMGFGALLGPTNEAVNTIINQLIDAGTLSNLGGGFLGRGMRTKGGAIRLRPGEFVQLPISGDDIKKNIYPAPIKEPSQTLFQLLSLLIEGGERIGSISDMLMGENPGQNQPWSTTQAVIEQGLKVFTSIYHRLHRSMSREYEKIYRLNAIYLDDNSHVDPSSLEVYRLTKADFTEYDHLLQPSGDPDVVTDTQKIMKADMLKEKLAIMPLNTQEVNRRILEAEGHEDISVLMDTQTNPQDPKLVFELKQFEHKQQMDRMDVQLKVMDLQNETLKAKSMSLAHIARATNLDSKTQENLIKNALIEVDREDEALEKQMDTLMGLLTEIRESEKSQQSAKNEGVKRIIEAAKVEKDGTTGSTKSP